MHGSQSGGRRMNIDIETLLPDLEGLTPEGRWNMLQSWLSENPEYGERVERWSTQTVDEVFDELLALARKRHGDFAYFAFSLPVIAAKIRLAIVVLQACYRERANHKQLEQQKEIKHVRPRKRTGRKDRSQV